MPLEYNKDLIPRAKELRKNATRQENHLWYDFLRLYPARFQRQKAIYHYIVDFYCASAKLIVELDGHQHDSIDAQEHDSLRTQAFESAELTVIRFKNEDVENHFRAVCQAIDQAVKQRLGRIPRFPREGAEGVSHLEGETL